jgi:hypothetical protein
MGLRTSTVVARRAHAVDEAVAVHVHVRQRGLRDRLTDVAGE